MKVLFMVIFSLVYCISDAQEWEYAEIYEISSGMVQTKAEFTFGAKYDSAKAYGKFKHAVDALDFSSKKGWEFVPGIHTKHYCGGYCLPVETKENSEFYTVSLENSRIDSF